jgi:hypothetical protein
MEDLSKADDRVTWLVNGAHETSGCPAWEHTCALDEAGVAYISAGHRELKMMEFAVLCAMTGERDCEPVLKKDGHFYFPTPWLARQFPETAAHLNKLQARVRRECGWQLH